MSFMLESLWRQSVKTEPITNPVQVLDFYQALKAMGTLNPNDPPMFSGDEVDRFFQDKFNAGKIMVPGCWSLRDILFEGWIRRPRGRSKRVDLTKRRNIIKPKLVSKGSEV